MNSEDDQRPINHLVSTMAEKRRAAFNVPTRKKPLLTTDFSVEIIPVPSGNTSAAFAPAPLGAPVSSTLESSSVQETQKLTQPLPSHKCSRKFQSSRLTQTQLKEIPQFEWKERPALLSARMWDLTSFGLV